METVTGLVVRHWRTAQGSEGCRLQVGSAEIALYGPLPAVTRGATLEVSHEQGEIKQAKRIIRDWEVARTFYGLIPGFSGQAALGIVSKLGDETHYLITQESSSLSGVKGIPASGVKAMRKHAKQKGRLYPAIRALADLGLPPEHARVLLREYGSGAPKFFAENPYLAIRHGLPLRLLDAAAKIQGMSLFDPRRGPALAYEVLRRAEQEYGHTCLTGIMLRGELRDLHALEEDEAGQALLDAVSTKLLEHRLGAYYRPRLWRTEKWLAEDTLRLFLGSAKSVPPLNAPHLTDEQAAAVELGCTSQVCVITGGPGTGKTTTLKVLLESLEAAKLRVTLAAPTGKAASRMTQSTGREATTLHRLLNYDGEVFSNHRLETDALVIDEVSMSSNELLGAVLRVLPDQARVILVGDEDQLPPIDPGHPLAALCETMPVARLTKTHRQAQGSPILTLAGQLISGQPPVETGVPFRPAQRPEDLVTLVQERMTEAGPPMVLTAGKAGPLGVTGLNAALQAALNPGAEPWRVGDPVMVTKNNHDTGLMNGMTGRVVEIGKNGMTCLFEEEPHVFSVGEALPLMLAYAMTIHRSQGSEWPSVVVALSLGHERLLSRQLAYTAGFCQVKLLR